MKIMIPSYKRAKSVLTTKYIKEGIVCCHKSEEKEYRKYNSGKILIMPDKAKGNMAKVRNWILDKCPDENIVMMDDDIMNIQYVENNMQYKMEVNRYKQVLKNGFEMAKEFGTVLWGFNLQADPMFYREYSPFSMLSVILGPMMCIRNIDKRIRFDERLPFKEDYDYSLQVLYYYHKILRFNKYSYIAKHINNKGGCVGRRAKKIEIDQLKLFQEKWGKDVVRYNINKSINPIVKIPLKGL